VDLVSADDSRLNIAILDVVSDSQEKSQNQIVYGYIIDAVHEIDDFNIVERVEIDKAIDELNFTMSGLVDEESVQEMGKITGAEYILLSEFGFSEGKYFLSMRIVSTETGQVTGTSVQSVKSFNAVKTLVRNGVDELLNRQKKVLLVPPYLSVSSDFMYSFPLEPISDVLKNGYNLNVGVALNLDFKWGTLYFGFVTAGSLFNTDDSVASSYRLYSIPFALSAAYRTSFTSSFYLFTRVAAGGIYSSLVYTGSGSKVVSAVDFYWSARMGMGIMVSDNLGIQIFCDYSWIGYNRDAYKGISPGLGAVFLF